MRTYRDFINEVNSVMGLGPVKATPIKDYSEENKQLKKELRKAKDKASVIKQMYNSEISKKEKN